MFFINMLLVLVLAPIVGKVMSSIFGAMCEWLFESKLFGGKGLNWGAAALVGLPVVVIGYLAFALR